MEVCITDGRQYKSTMAELYKKVLQMWKMWSTYYRILWH